MTEAIPLAITPKGIELRCPRCGALELVIERDTTVHVAVTTNDRGVSGGVRIRTRCRRCRAIFTADLQATPPVATIAPE